MIIGLLKKSEKNVSIISSWFAIIGTIVTIVAALSTVLKNVNINIFPFLVDNLLIIWGSTITIYIILLTIWLSRLNNKFTKGLKENFKDELNEKWDYTGNWTKPEKGTLLISNSDPGGISKKGALWENYTIKFQAKIINKCIGLIVRAQDIDNYYMFQISKSHISPHRRTSILQISDNKVIAKDEINIVNIDYKSGWKVFKESIVPHNLNLDDWFKIKAVVNGQSIQIYINEQLVFHENSFLQIPMGKIGFRNFKLEKALVKNLKVELNN